jgi:MFS family permease
MTGARPRLPRAVWALGLVSLFMDLSSEAVLALLPVYLVSVLGASTLAVGAIEGVAEATANITKVFSGALSDRIGERKRLAVLGYGLAALTKPIFPLAGSVGWVVAARFLDRIGKGIRAAPRDALLADVTPAEQRGAAFGLRQALDTVGAFLGPLMAMLLMAASGDDFRLVFWVAVVPAFASVALLVLLVREPARRTSERRAALHWADARRLPLRFWAAVGVASLLALGRFSDAFLILRAQQAGLGLALVPLVMVVMNAVYALGSYPAGALSDRLGRRRVLALGVVALVAADALLAWDGGVATVLLGVAVWGLHMALTQGVFASLVADTAPEDLRGSAFGVFNFAIGVAALVASVLAGWLWGAYGPAATFLVGGALAVAGWVALVARR